MDLNLLSDKIHTLVKQLDKQNRGILDTFRSTRGFSPRMSPAELLTFMIYFHFTRFKDFKAFCQHMHQHHTDTFTQQLHYKTLCAWRTRLLPVCNAIMHMLMLKATDTEEKFIDSSHLDICHPIRADRNRIALYAARKSKNRMGWHHGFKLHLAINRIGQIIGYDITAANADDRNSVEKICRGRSGNVYADRGYLGKRLAADLVKKGIRLVTRNRGNMPHKKLSVYDRELLKKRTIIETIIGVLKSRHHIEHSRHRSYAGFVVNVLMGLIAYCLRANKPCF